MTLNLTVTCILKAKWVNNLYIRVCYTLTL